MKFHGFIRMPAAWLLIAGVSIAAPGCGEHKTGANSDDTTEIGFNFEVLRQAQAQDGPRALGLQLLDTTAFIRVVSPERDILHEERVIGLRSLSFMVPNGPDRTIIIAAFIPYRDGNSPMFVTGGAARVDLNGGYVVVPIDVAPVPTGSIIASVAPELARSQAVLSVLEPSFGIELYRGTIAEIAGSGTADGDGLLDGIRPDDATTGTIDTADTTTVTQLELSGLPLGYELEFTLDTGAAVFRRRTVIESEVTDLGYIDRR